MSEKDVTTGSVRPPMFRPADIILAIGLIVIGFVMSFFLVFGGDDGAQIKVQTAGKLYGVYSLDEDQTVTIRQGSKINEFEIKDGAVRMIHASCHNHDCIQQGIVTLENRYERILSNMIICLPNQVTLQLLTPEEVLEMMQGREEPTEGEDGK